MKKIFIYDFLFFFLLLIIDLFSKYLAKNYLIGEQKIISNLFSLKYSSNSGIAFSLPLEGILLKIITIILVLTLFYFYYLEIQKSKIENNNFARIGLVFMISGAIGNGIERILFAEVTDFLYLKGFAIMNFADIFINIGVILIIISLFSFRQKS